MTGGAIDLGDGARFAPQSITLVVLAPDGD
jgi:hypothetical protein